MARGKLRIRQRGSRQQWAQARNFKQFASDEGQAAGESSDSAPRALGGADVVASTRCGCCGAVAEQRLRDGREVVLLANALCISCDEVRCEACWDDPGDACADAEEHEFMEVRYSGEEGGVATAEFAEFAER